jgi:hypothetical protein
MGNKPQKEVITIYNIVSIENKEIVCKCYSRKVAENLVDIMANVMMIEGNEQVYK